jgi:hypothetical protein
VRRRLTNPIWWLVYLSLAVPVIHVIRLAFPWWYDVPLMILAVWQCFQIADLVTQALPWWRR